MRKLRWQKKRGKIGWKWWQEDGGESLSLFFSLLQTHFWKSCWIIFSFSQPPILLQNTSHFNGRGEWTVVRPYSSSENQIKSSMPDTKVSKTCVHEWTLQLLSAEMDRLRLSFLERRTRSRWLRSTSSPGQGWIIDMCLCHVNESRPEPHRNQTLKWEESCRRSSRLIRAGQKWSCKLSWNFAFLKLTTRAKSTEKKTQKVIWACNFLRSSSLTLDMCRLRRLTFP